MNADSFEEETACARADTEPTVTNEAQAPKVQRSCYCWHLSAFIGVHRRFLKDWGAPRQKQG